MTHTYDAIVIGGGIHGCSTALFLARKGRRVVVLEKDHAARHASGVNSGGVREKLTQLGLEVVGGRSQDFAQLIVRESRRWSDVAKRAGIRAE